MHANYLLLLSIHCNNNNQVTLHTTADTILTIVHRSHLGHHLLQMVTLGPVMLAPCCAVVPETDSDVWLLEQHSTSHKTTHFLSHLVARYPLYQVDCGSGRFDGVCHVAG